MIHLRLSHADRERLGCPEWLDLDVYSVTAREAAIMQRGFDLDGERAAFAHPGVWRNALGGGDDRVPNFAAITMLVWLALRRVDVVVPLAEVADIVVEQLAYKGDPVDVPEDEPDPQASPGKDDEPQPSPSSDAQLRTSPA